MFKYANILRKLYTDKMTVYRYVDIENEDHTTNSVLCEIPVLENIACRFSYKTQDAPLSSNDTTNPLKAIGKVFCNLSVDVQKGDYIKVVCENGALHEGIANKPARYDDHQEIIIGIEGTA